MCEFFFRDETNTLPVAGADHLLPLRDPAALATITAEFIRRHPRPSMAIRQGSAAARD